MEQKRFPLKDRIEIWILQDKTTGEVWSTPKGKAHWSGKGYAKNAWNCHNYRYSFDDPRSDHNLEPIKVAEYFLRD